MNILRKFLSGSYKNMNRDKQIQLRRKLQFILWVDRDFDATWNKIRVLQKYGGFGYNCFFSEKPLWWTTKIKDED